MDKELQDEIIKLETKLAYMEDFLNQLQEVTVEHTNLIEKLEKENKILSQKVCDMAEQLDGDIPNRKPPHY